MAKSNMNYELVLQKIHLSRTMKELDKVAIDFYSNVEDRNSYYSREINLAIQQRESELMTKLYQEEPTDLVRKPEDNAIPFALTRRKQTPIEDAFIDDILLLNDVKCGCVMRHGVPCIHKTSYKGILPDNYHECETCGCDHALDPRLAKEVHDKLGEKI